MLLRNLKYHPDQLDGAKIKEQFEEFDRIYPHQNSDDFKFLEEQPPRKIEISKAIV